MVERAGLENRYTSDTPSDETSEAAKTYDDSGSDGQDALAPDLRTDGDLAAVVDAWPTLAEPIKAGILAMVKAANQPHRNRSQDDDDLPTDTDRR